MPETCDSVFSIWRSLRPVQLPFDFTWPFTSGRGANKPLHVARIPFVTEPTAMRLKPLLFWQRQPHVTNYDLRPAATLHLLIMFSLLSSFVRSSTSLYFPSRQLPRPFSHLLASLGKGVSWTRSTKAGEHTSANRPTELLLQCKSGIMLRFSGATGDLKEDINSRLTSRRFEHQPNYRHCFIAYVNM